MTQDNTYRITSKTKTYRITSETKQDTSYRNTYAKDLSSSADQKLLI